MADEVTRAAGSGGTALLERPAPIPVTVDINVYLHAIDSRHPMHEASQQTLVRLFSDPRFSIATSEHVLNHIYEKSVTHLGMSEALAGKVITALEDKLLEQNPVLDPDPQAIGDFIQDREDNHILALAKESGSKIIVSNDVKDLASLGHWRNVPILTAAGFNARARDGLQYTDAELPNGRPSPRRLIDQITTAVSEGQDDFGPSL